MRKALIIALAIVAAACTNKKQGAATDGEAPADSTATTAALTEDTSLQPVFVYCMAPDSLQVIYWEEDSLGEYADTLNWQLQQQLRQHASEYTQVMTSPTSGIEVKFAEETLLDPDGEPAVAGSIRNVWYPMKGLRYQLAERDNPQGKELGAFHLLVTPDYLKTHKPLEVKLNPWGGTEDDKPMPANIIKLLEERYNLSTKRSHIVATLDSGRIQLGIVQFKPKDTKALALEVMTRDGQVYCHENEGNYDPEAPYSIWNVDDDGIYFPFGLKAAFEGPEGISFYYTRWAIESAATGRYIVKDDKLVRQQHGLYYVYPENPRPIWRSKVKFKSTQKKDENGQVCGVTVSAMCDGETIETFEAELPWPKDPNLCGNVGATAEDDINFDGKPDLTVFLGSFGTGNVSQIYDAWLWSSDNHSFVHVDGYSDIANPELDKEQKCIIGRSYNSSEEVEVNQYVWDYYTLKHEKSWTETAKK